MPFSPSEPFVPAFGLGSAHAQTIFASFFRPSDTPPMRRERWELPDGDFLDVDRLDAPPSAPHLLLLHGLEGSSKAGYIAAILRGAAAQGWGAVALNFRSCSGELNRLPRFYHSGETGDALYALERLRAETSGPWFGVGFSLGGNVLLRLMAETGENAPLDAAAAVSVPFDLLRCARALDQGKGFTAIYRRVFLRSLKEKALEKERCHPGALDARAVREADGIEAYDDAVTAKLHGFGTAAAYYQACSSGPALTRIRKPTLILSAADDPLVPLESLPVEARENPALSIVIAPAGGHVGFVSGSVVRPRFWAEDQVLGFLAGLNVRGVE